MWPEQIIGVKSRKVIAGHAQEIEAVLIFCSKLTVLVNSSEITQNYFQKPLNIVKWWIIVSYLGYLFHTV